MIFKGHSLKQIKATFQEGESPTLNRDSEKVLSACLKKVNICFTVNGLIESHYYRF